MPRPVQRDTGSLNDRRQGGPRAATQRAHPRDQFGESERLSQVVIRAEIEPVHPVPDPGRGGQHQDPPCLIRTG
jgi:hypothetical protein